MEVEKTQKLLEKQDKLTIKQVRKIEQNLIVLLIIKIKTMGGLKITDLLYNQNILKTV